MLKYLLLIFLSVLTTESIANNKENIINNLKNTNNVSFEFEQNINQKIEKGNCIVQYPKKIFCEYVGSNNKVLVSNGKSLVIKTKTSYYRYPLEKTPLNYILDKNFLIKKIYNLKENVLDNSFINFIINENDNEINVFFEKTTSNLIGWQTKDIYQNVSITLLSSVKKNEIIDEDLFTIPLQN